MIEQYLLMLEDTRLSDYDRIRGAIESRIMELEAEYRYHGVSRPFLSALEEITSLAEGLHACIEEDRAAIEKLCFKLQRILLQVRGEYVELTPVSADSPVSDEKEQYPISSVSIRSQSLSFSLDHGGDDTACCVEYRHNPDVMEKVRHLLNSIVKSDNEILLDALWHTSATCFMCGECCKSYRVEVTPIDVDRMASHFHMTVEAFRKKYLFPPAFAWNEGNAMLAKIDPQPPDQHFSYSECLFLRNREKGMSYCSIYEARPDVCREYHASNQLCKRIHQLKRAESLVDNIVSLEIEAHTLVLVTKQTTCQDPPHIRLDMEEEKQILAAYNSLKKALRECVN